MTKKYKWEIKGLSAGKSFKTSAKIILQRRLKSLTNTIKKFLNEETSENLHQIRIALRRLRYNMEIFISCFDKEIFIAFYQEVAKLQDMTGTKRDLDVLADNVKSFSSGGKDVDSFLGEVEEKNRKLKDELTLELMKFTHGSELKDFNKMIL
ncbi:MAG: CHAD domain-containing protein [Ignavibacteriaceae bacterium]|nr:CHAD domain-containing protein [Ignavibacteriaceae bacterium]